MLGEGGKVQGDRNASFRGRSWPAAGVLNIETPQASLKPLILTPAQGTLYVLDPRLHSSAGAGQLLLGGPLAAQGVSTGGTGCCIRQRNRWVSN